MRICRKCNKPGEFGKDKNKADGVSVFCKPCVNRATRERRIRLISKASVDVEALKRSIRAEQPAVPVERTTLTEEDFRVRPPPELPEFEIDVVDPDPTPPAWPAPAERPTKILFVPDCHVPYHDKKAFSLMLRAAEAFQPEIVVTLGDFADFYAVSSHSKDPRRVNVLDWELEQVANELKRFDHIASVKRKVFIAGNHCDRYDRYIADRAPALHKIGALKDILGLAELGWEFVPYKQHIQIGKLFITHDIGKAGKLAHYDAQAAFEGNAIIGHTHRLGYAVMGSVQGKPHVGAMLGWLGDLEQVDYMHKARALRDWAHGFGLGYLLTDGCVHVVPTPIVNGKVIIEGQVVT